MSLSIDYYTAHAQQLAPLFNKRDLSAVYARFCPLLPQGAHVLDAGCGTGRDARYFIEQGYTVTAFDLCEEMVRVASEYSGQTVHKMGFQDMNYKEQFHGIWANASLLHVPKAEIRDIFRKFIQALVPGGVWMMSFKHGETERIYPDHITNDYTQEGLRQLIQEFPQLEVLEMWQEPNLEPKRPGDMWVRAVVRRVN